MAGSRKWPSCVAGRIDAGDRLLAAAEWKSGPHLRIIDVVAPFGGEAEMRKQIAEVGWGVRKRTVRSRDWSCGKLCRDRSIANLATRRCKLGRSDDFGGCLAGKPTYLKGLSRGTLTMAYLLEPVNSPYDLQEPLPTPRGFTVQPAAFKGGGNVFKRQFKPVTPEKLPRIVVVGGDRPMPDFFSLAANHYYVSNRFREVVDKFAHGALEFIEVPFTISANKNPAGAYYFTNVLGRAQLIDWDLSPKQGPSSGLGGKRYYDLVNLLRIDGHL